MTSSRRDVAVTLALGAVFITLGSLRTLLIKFSENEAGHYDYVPVSVNVCAELIKLVVCSSLAVKVIVQDYKSDYKSGKGQGLLCASREDVVRFMEWAVPGGLYFIDNLIAFYTMEYFQPAMVVLLGNFYIITTSLLFRLILKRRFSRPQWTAIVILFLSIMLLSLQTNGAVTIDHHKSHHAIHSTGDAANHAGSDLNTGSNETSTISPVVCEYYELRRGGKRSIANNSTSTILKSTEIPQWRHNLKFHFHEGHVLILFQCLISSTANVYNEKIFKENGGLEESIYIQNSKLYIFGLIFNTASLLLHGAYREKLFECGFFSGHNLFSLALIVVTAFYGLTVALIFKFRNNMFHVMNTQVTTVLVITASMYYFGFKPKAEFFLAAPIVLASIYLFNISKLKENVELAEEVRRPVVFRDEDRPLVPVLDQNED